MQLLSLVVESKLLLLSSSLVCMSVSKNYDQSSDPEEFDSDILHCSSTFVQQQCKEIRDYTNQIDLRRICKLNLQEKIVNKIQQLDC